MQGHALSIARRAQQRLGQHVKNGLSRPLVCATDNAVNLRRALEKNASGQHLNAVKVGQQRLARGAVDAAHGEGHTRKTVLHAPEEREWRERGRESGP